MNVFWSNLLLLWNIVRYSFPIKAVYVLFSNSVFLLFFHFPFYKYIFYFLHFCTFCNSAFPLLGSLLSWGTLKYYLFCYKIIYIFYSVHLQILLCLIHTYRHLVVHNSLPVYCTVYLYGIIKQPVMCTVQYICTEL